MNDEIKNLQKKIDQLSNLTIKNGCTENEVEVAKKKRIILQNKLDELLDKSNEEYNKNLQKNININKSNNDVPEIPSLEEYEEILKNFDWEYHNSDDFEYWDKHQTLFNRFSEINRLGHAYRGLYNKYKKY